jgi:hypothetical protein
MKHLVSYFGLKPLRTGERKLLYTIVRDDAKRLDVYSDMTTDEIEKWANVQSGYAIVYNQVEESEAENK